MDLNTANNTDQIALSQDLGTKLENKEVIKINHLIIGEQKTQTIDVRINPTSDQNVLVKTYLSPLVIKKRRYKRKGNWGLDEEAKYYLFLTRSLKDFISTSIRKYEKIFKRMSEYIGSRTSAQCRSHHQKHRNKNPKLQNLLQNLYILAKDHPILENQPVFSKFDLIYQQFFDLMDQKSEKQTKVDICIVSIEISYKVQQWVFYEMPHFLEPITEAYYMKLVQQKKAQEIDKQQ